MQQNMQQIFQITWQKYLGQNKESFSKFNWNLVGNCEGNLVNRIMDNTINKNNPIPGHHFSVHRRRRQPDFPQELEIIRGVQAGALGAEVAIIFWRKCDFDFDKKSAKKLETRLLNMTIHEKRF